MPFSASWARFLCGKVNWFDNGFLRDYAARPASQGGKRGFVYSLVQSSRASGVSGWLIRAEWSVNLYIRPYPLENSGSRPLSHR